MRRRGVGRHFVARPMCPAATDFPFRFGRLRFPDRRRAFLLRGHRQFKRRGVADFDWNANAGRLIDRARFFRIRVASIVGEARDFGLRSVGADRRVGQLAQTIEFISAFESGADEELPHFGMTVAVN